MRNGLMRKSRVLKVISVLLPLALTGCALNSGSSARLSGASALTKSHHSSLASSLGLGGLFGPSQSDTSFVPPSEERLPEPMPPVEIALTPEVRRELNRYLQVHRVGLEDAFARRERYLPMMEAIFRDEGLPAELLALPIIESGYNPLARSPVGARGLWQFMPGTARHYGLVVNKRVDERLDPVLSTIAAAKFLRDLYNEQGDWHLALAAYNAGSGGITRAMNRTRSRDYWQLCRARRGITDQTRQFVPKFIAAAVIARRWNRYDSVELAADPNLLLAGMHPDA